ncbi:octopamine receptor beta-2R-like [Porites lutea]|uniref:octopamine receptor beta-2R-like n=1 Tax=Porites lutea TaxID=51062 RepID=UPI003CC67EC2
METWFWILGWFLSFQTIIGNGFTIFLVCSRRNLRTKTNAFIVSLAVADFCVGLSVFPSLFFCDISNTCYWPQHLLSWSSLVNIISRRNLRTKTNAFIVSLTAADFCVGLSVVPSLFACDVTNTCYWPQVFLSWKDVVRWLFSYLSVLNLCSLVLDRYIAIVKPFKYLTFMTRSRVIQVITFSWIASFTLVTFKTALRLCCETPLTSIVAVVVLMISMEIVPCVLQILLFVSMLIHVRKQDRSACTLGRISFKTHNEKSAVIMMGLVIGVFVVCYGIYLRCSLVVLCDTNASCKDEQYKIPVLVLNSAINPMCYAFFKRDIKQEFKRLISQVVFFKRKSNRVEPST